MALSNYVTWLFDLETFLGGFNIAYSEYDEFHLCEARVITEHIIKQYNLGLLEHLTEAMIDEYTKNAINKDSKRRDYYETISAYMKKRVLWVQYL